MKVFILEDDSLRMLWLRERLFHHEITHADSCAHADRYVPPYDLVLLDHDLGGRQLDAHEDNGERFAGLVRPLVHAMPPLVVIHSYNPGGAARIRNALMALPRPAGLVVVLAPFGGPLFKGCIDQAERVAGLKSADGESVECRTDGSTRWREGWRA